MDGPVAPSGQRHAHLDVGDGHARPTFARRSLRESRARRRCEADLLNRGLARAADRTARRSRRLHCLRSSRRSRPPASRHSRRWRAPRQAAMLGAAREGPAPLPPEPTLRRPIRPALRQSCPRWLHARCVCVHVHPAFPDGGPSCQTFPHLCRTTRRSHRTTRRSSTTQRR